MITPSEEHIQRVEQRVTLLMKHQEEKYARARNQRESRRRQYRLVSWGVVADRVERHFFTAALCSRTQNWFEHLYVHRDNGHRTVQLFFGQHPVPSPGFMDVERGATLVVSQNALGGVIVLFYPFETNAVQRTKLRVIWRILHGPEELSERLILRMIDEFLTYSRVSSVLFKSSRWEASRVSRLERRSRLIEGSEGGMRLWGATIAILVVGSIGTGGIYIAWALDESRSWLEPYAGLAALVTGWIAFRVQLGRDAIDRATAKEEAEKADYAHKQTLESST